jgi:cyclic nucleotide-binding protein
LGASYGKEADMRIESSVTAVSWIPMEAVEGIAEMPFNAGVAHYDSPPPAVLDDVKELVAADRVREANELRAFIDVEDGRITDFGHIGQGHIGVTKLKLGRRDVSVPAVALPLIRPEPMVGPSYVNFRQTAGGRTGVPSPRHVKGRPFFQVEAPIAWTTLSLTIHADGSSESECVGASTFPRHWIYDDSGKLESKSGLIDFKRWYRNAFDKHTPWGQWDSPALMTQVESSLEREISAELLKPDSKPNWLKVKAGEKLVDQGALGDEMYLLFDGMLGVEIDGKEVAHVGPGSILGERALLEGGKRTATLKALTNCRVAVIGKEQVDRSKLEEVAKSHHREE